MIKEVLARRSGELVLVNPAAQWRRRCRGSRRLEQLSGPGRRARMFMTMQHSARRRRLRPMRRALARHRAG